MKKTIIFDMDGTLVDNADYHRKAWKKFAEKYKEINADDVEKWFGKTNHLILKHLFQDKLKQDEIEAYAREKEKIYRQLYQPYIKPVNGFFSLLQKISRTEFQLAIATSAPPENVRFVLEHLNLTQIFPVVVDETMVVESKPHPEIFLKTAEKSGSAPGDCLVFEDSVHGVDAARAAGMKVIALTTTLKGEELKHANAVVKDYTEVDLSFIYNLVGA